MNLVKQKVIYLIINITKTKYIALMEQEEQNLALFWKQVTPFYNNIVKTAKYTYYRIVKNRNMAEQADDAVLKVLEGMIKRVKRDSDYLGTIKDLEGYIITSVKNEILRINEEPYSVDFSDKVQFDVDIQNREEADEDLEIATTLINSLVNLPFKEVPELDKSILLSYVINVGELNHSLLDEPVKAKKWGKSFNVLSEEVGISKPQLMKIVDKLISYLLFYFTNGFYMRSNKRLKNDIMKYELKDSKLYAEGLIAMQAKYGYATNFEKFMDAVKIVLNIELQPKVKYSRKQLKALTDQLFDELFIANDVSNETNLLTDLINDNEETNYSNDSKKEVDNKTKSSKKESNKRIGSSGSNSDRSDDERLLKQENRGRKQGKLNKVNSTE